MDRIPSDMAIGRYLSKTLSEFTSADGFAYFYC